MKDEDDRYVNITLSTTFFRTIYIVFLDHDSGTCVLACKSHQKGRGHMLTAKIGKDRGRPV